MGCASSTPAAVDGKSKISTEESKLYPIYGPNDIMSQKKHGTSDTPVQHDLRWNCNRNDADNICNFNRRGAEWKGSFAENSAFSHELERCKRKHVTMKFYDSNTGNILFEAPIGRSHSEFWKESKSHGWPSFRDPEVHWEHTRCLPDGECVSFAGTHLGHNLPDPSGNRYCINLISVCGNPTTTTTSTSPNDN